jgi:hypothetical protein
MRVRKTALIRGVSVVVMGVGALLTTPRDSAANEACIICVYGGCPSNGPETCAAFPYCASYTGCMPGGGGHPACWDEPGWSRVYCWTGAME